MAAPATLPTTPPTTTGVDGVLESEFPFPESPVLDAGPAEATPVPPASNPPTWVEVAVVFEKLGE